MNTSRPTAVLLLRMRSLASLRASAGAAGLLACAACASGSGGSGATSASSAPSGDCSVRSSLRPTFASADHAGSVIALAEHDGCALAFIADEDDRTLHVLDIVQRKELATVPLAGTPAQVLVTSNGRVLVTLRDAARVEVFTPDGDRDERLVSRCTVPTAAEPYGLAESKDASTVVVTSGWGHALEVLRGSDLSRRAEVSLPREPRGVVISDDGRSAVVSHVVGSVLSVVDLARAGSVRAVDVRGAPEERSITARRTKTETETRVATTRRSSVQGYALAKVQGHVVGPRVLVDPGELTEVPTYYGSSDRQVEIPDLAVFDDELRPVLPRAAAATRGGGRSSSREDDCRLPRAVAENTADHTALVTCLGSDTVVEYALDALPGSLAGSVARPRGRWAVASGPTGVAYDGARRQALVWSQFAHAVSFVALPTGSLEDRLVAEKDRLTRWNLARPASIVRDGEVEAGRDLFFATGDPRLSREGLACASCHPDGRDDALTWATSDGPRQTPMLAGRLEGTAPYAWSGTSERVSEHLDHTLQRLGGTGLKERDMAAIASYCATMKTFPAGASGESARVARGREIFASADTGCSSCHPGASGVFTDRHKHDVGSRTLTDDTGAFDTPSLRSVGNSGPYFHDGRYATLDALLRGTSGTMGRTSQLSPDDLRALEAYLTTL